MAKGRRQLESIGGALDLLIEVRDARAPRLTASPALEGLSGLTVWTVLSKADLADEAVTAMWTESISKSDSRHVWALDLRRDIPQAMRRAVLSFRPKSSGSRTYREARVAVVGTPNVGKSTILNRLVGRRAAQVGGVPGVTKGVSWYRCDGILAADSPGILDPRDDARAHRMLSWLSSTKGQVVGSWQTHSAECLAYMARHDLIGALRDTWGIDVDGTPDDLLRRIGVRLGKLVRGGEVDLEAAGRAFIDALSAGRLGRLTLERPDDPAPWLELQ